MGAGMKRYVLILMLLFSTAAISATVKWTDENGNVHYSDQPPPVGVKTQAVRSSETQSNKSQVNDAAKENVGSYSLMDKPGGQGQINNVDAVPYLTDGGRARYREFLAHANPRAFVVCQNGTFRIVYGDRAHSSALREQDGNCELYAIDDEVVWRGR